MKLIFKRMAVFILLAAYIFTGGYKEFALNDPSNSVPKTGTKNLSIPMVPIYDTRFVRQDNYGIFYKTVLGRAKRGEK